MLEHRLVSSLEKCFPDSDITTFPHLSRLSVLKNQPFSFQILCVKREEVWRGCPAVCCTVEGVGAAHVTVRSVEYIPAHMVAYPNQSDEGYVRTAPGLYPDLLRPLSGRGTIPLRPDFATAIWFDVAAGALSAGEHVLHIAISENGEVLGEETLTVEVIDACLPEQSLIVTQWFHIDCLMNHYHVEAFDEECWRIVENFARTAAKNGINMILTPVFTPPLDTEVGGERRTVQLVDVIYKNGTYSFGYAKLDRFIRMAKSVGIRYFEIAHLFTQWGAKHAPKIMAETEQGMRRIFGWETEADSPEYAAFLAAFLPALRDHLRELGIEGDCVFHISDEPTEPNEESYRRALAVARPHLEGATVIDALSDIRFYKEGLVEHPVPGCDHIEPFLAEDIPGLWTYYCCCQGVGVSNRFFGMPGARTRYMGTQMFCYDIAGFLQWGYNFYSTGLSKEPIDPFACADACGAFPAGDGFSVYPGTDGTAWESMRLLHFREGLEDMRAMQLAASLVGKETVVSAIEAIMGKVTFDRCATDSQTMLAVREAVNGIIRANV